MKFILTMYICSAIAQQCSPGIIKPGQYNDWNDCLQKGYFESKLILNEVLETGQRRFSLIIFSVVLLEQ